MQHGVWWGDVCVPGCAREQDAKHSLEEEHRGLVSASLPLSSLILVSTKVFNASRRVQNQLRLDGSSPADLPPADVQPGPPELHLHLHQLRCLVNFLFSLTFTHITLILQVRLTDWKLRECHQAARRQ